MGPRALLFGSLDPWGGSKVNGTLRESSLDGQTGQRAAGVLTDMRSLDVVPKIEAANFHVTL